jgi:predicted DNA-binding transcriptional regulator AlpA
MKYSVQDVVTATGISASTVQRWLLTDRFPSSKIGRAYALDEKTYQRVVEYARDQANNTVPIKRSPALSLRRQPLPQNKNNIRKWPTVDHQIRATISGEIEPIYLNRQGARIK